MTGHAPRPPGCSWRPCPTEAELAEGLRPAMTQDTTGECGFADVAWMLAKALRFLLQGAIAAQDGDAGGRDQALAETDADLLAAAGYAMVSCFELVEGVPSGAITRGQGAAYERGGTDADARTWLNWAKTAMDYADPTCHNRGPARTRRRDRG